MNRVNSTRPDDFTAEADSPRVITEPRILTPTIVILLGSTSALSALELMRHMLTLSVDDRHRVALVYIDTDDPSAALTEFRHQHNGVFQEFPLRIAVPSGISHGTKVPQDFSDPAAPSTNQDLELHTFVKGKEPQYFANGAGGIRNNGHVAACFHHQAIYDTLDSALVTVTRIDDTQSGKRFNEVQINIVAFLGGGTGSGILPDIAVMARDLLANYQYRQRINLICMLPEPVREANQTDLSWRKSNATACLLELLAYSVAAGARGGRYNKYMRDRVYRLTNDPIANEIYLIGHSSLGDVVGTARIVGLDLFQRITDASGVGFLEHSKWVDRRTLGETDDRALPTMFGTSCPLEVGFPAHQTAETFARIAASHLLPLIATFQPQQVSVSETDKRNWVREWESVARIDANPNDPRVIRPTVFNLESFVEADQYTLDNLWAKLQRFEEETERKVVEVLAAKRKEELQNIDEVSAQVTGSTANSRLPNTRIQHLQRLQQEYRTALDILEASGTPLVAQRPVDLEGDLTQPGTFWFRIRSMGRDYAYEVYNAYNQHLEAHAHATRYRLLEELLRELLQNARDAHSAAMSWLEEAQVQQHQQKLEISGMSSMAWKGLLDDAHPHQRHIFDLRTLRSGSGRNIAVERLYRWATGGDKALTQGTPIDYSSYVNRCIDYILRTTKDPRASQQKGDGHIESYNAGRLAERVVDFFHEHYMKTFQDMNLFELLDKAAPLSSKGQPRAQQLSDCLLEHLQYIGNLIGSLIAFEAELWAKGSSLLDTSIYLGMHWRDGYQRTLLDTALDNLGPLTERGQSARLEASLDPHRLQLVYGQHAISLSTVKDFYLKQNSSMSFYLYHQEKWENAGSDIYGYMPVHSCSEAQWLVRDRKALGYRPPITLFDRVIRESF